MTAYMRGMIRDPEWWLIFIFAVWAYLTWRK